MMQMADIELRDDKLAKRLVQIHEETPFDDDPYHARILSAAKKLIELGYGDAVYITSQTRTSAWYLEKTAFRVSYKDNTSEVAHVDLFG